MDHATPGCNQHCLADSVAFELGNPASTRLVAGIAIDRLNVLRGETVRDRPRPVAVWRA